MNKIQTMILQKKLKFEYNFDTNQSFKEKIIIEQK